MTSLADEILERTVRAYLDSRDFNGLRDIRLEPSLPLEAIRELIAARKVDAIFEDADPNPSIKRLCVESPEVQLEKLARESVPGFCLYPTPDVLAEEVAPPEFSDRPYALALAQGAAQLEHRAFDLSALEYYRNDPRYYYRCDDVHGMVAISDDYFESDDFPEQDKVLIQSFGFAYSKDFDRAVAVFLCDLAGLSPEHQQVWRAKELAGEYLLHPDFATTQLLGDFPTHIPIFTAFLMELDLVNQMCRAMGRPPMFRRTPDPGDPPRRFGFLIRPTRSEFDDFVHTLDKLISDNIDKAFFQGQVSDEDEVTRQDGKVVVQKRGTLQMFELWFRARFRAADWSPFDQMIAAFRKVRKLRQKPAHALQDDSFDQKYIRDQRQLMLEAYTGVRTLRLAFANHPNCATVSVPDVLYEGKIRDF